MTDTTATILILSLARINAVLDRPATTPTPARPRRSIWRRLLARVKIL